MLLANNLWVDSQFETAVANDVLLLNAINHTPALKDVGINKSRNLCPVKFEITVEFIVREADVAAPETVNAALAVLLMG